jgi:hypothetical protein
VKHDEARRQCAGDAMQAVNKIISAGIWIAAVAVSLQTTIHLVNVLFFGAVTFFDVDKERNLFTWSGSVMIFAVAFAATVRAVTVADRRGRFLLLAAVAAFFSLDEMAVFHERLGRNAVELLGVSDTFVRVLWPALYLPLLALAAFLLLSLPRRAPQRVRHLAAFGVGLLLLAVVAEVASVAIPRDVAPAVNWLNVLEVTLEEGAELGGWILLAAAFAAIAWDVEH